MKIKGIYCPNVVPFKEDRSINEHELRRYVSWLIDKGVSGLYPNGSSGEFIRLSFEERIRVVEIVADEVNGRVPILAGAAEPNVDLVLEACRRCADLGDYFELVGWTNTGRAQSNVGVSTISSTVIVRRKSNANMEKDVPSGGRCGCPRSSASTWLA